MLAPLLLLALASASSAGVTWYETATHRIKVKHEGGKQVGRWEYPREAPDLIYGPWGHGDTRVGPALRDAFRAARAAWNAGIQGGMPTAELKALQRRQMALAAGYWQVAGREALWKEPGMTGPLGGCIREGLCGAPPDALLGKTLVRSDQYPASHALPVPARGVVDWARAELGCLPPDDRPPPAPRAARPTTRPTPATKPAPRPAAKPAPAPARSAPVIPATHAAAPRCGPWRPGNGHVDRALFRELEPATKTYFATSVSAPDYARRAAEYKAVAVGLWAVGGREFLSREAGALVALQCFRPGNDCGMTPDAELAGAARSYSSALLAWATSGRAGPGPTLSARVTEGPPPALLRWAREQLGCGAGTATVAPSPAAIRSLGAAPVAAPPAPARAAAPVQAAAPADESWRIGTGRVVNELNKVANEWGRQPGRNSLRYPPREAFFGGGKATTDRARRAMGEVLARGGSYAEAAEAGSFSGAALACLLVKAAEDGKYVPLGYLGAAAPYLSPYLQRDVQYRLGKLGPPAPAAAAGPAATATRPAYTPPAATYRPVTENAETRRSDAIRKQREYERKLDQRIYQRR